MNEETESCGTEPECEGFCFNNMWCRYLWLEGGGQEVAALLANSCILLEDSKVRFTNTYTCAFFNVHLFSVIIIFQISSPTTNSTQESLTKNLIKFTLVLVLSV